MSAYLGTKCPRNIGAAVLSISLVAVTVTVFWGERVLHVRSLRDRRRFALGAEPGDYPTPPQVLGTHHLELVEWTREGPWVRVPPGATADCSTGPRRGVDPYRTSTESCRVLLEPGGTVLVELGHLRVKVAYDTNGSWFRRWAPPDRRLALFGALTLVVQLLLLAATAFAVPSHCVLPDTSAQSRPRGSSAFRLVRAAALPEIEEPPLRRTIEDQRAPVDLPRDTQNHSGRLGQEQPTSGGHWGLMGPKDNPDPHVSRRRAWGDCWGYPLGINQEPMAGDPNAVVVPWGRDTSLGQDELSRRGALRGQGPGDSWGADPTPTSDRPGGMKKRLTFDHVELLPPSPTAKPLEQRSSGSRAWRRRIRFAR